MQKVIRHLPGIALCLIIALPAWFLGKALPVIGGPIFAIVAGITVSTLFPGLLKGSSALASGVKFTSKKILQYAIVFLGFGMNLGNLIKVGGQSLYVMLFTLTAAFLTAFFVGKALRLPGNTVTLIGVGTAICGGSAIAATAPVIQAKDEEVTNAISTIFLFNIVAVFIFPMLGRMIGMSDTAFGLWAGTAINDTSSVAAAATSWSTLAGNTAALQFATIVKLTRTLMIVPITLVLAIVTARKQKRAGVGEFQFIKVFPWFVLFFVLAAVVSTVAGLPAWLTGDLKTAGMFMIVMAMAAIGLNTNLKSLLANGLRPIALGLCCWASVAIVSLIVQFVMKMI